MTQGSEKRIRTERRTIRFTPDECTAVDRSAERAGLAFGSYARQVLLDAPVPRQVRRPPIERKELGRLLGELGHVGANLNQLARASNRGMPVSHRELAEELAALQRIRDAILAALGRAR